MAEAEDNLHNAFIEIFTNIKKFDSKGSFEVVLIYSYATFLKYSDCLLITKKK